MRAKDDSWTKILETDKNHILIEPKFFTLDELVEQFLWRDANIDDYKNIACATNGIRTIFGSWLYTKRNVVRSKNGHKYYVDLNSFEPNRALLIKGAIQYLYGLNIRDTSKASYAPRLEKFIDWLNRTQTKTPTNTQKAKETFRAFSQYLDHIVKTHSPKNINNKPDEHSFGKNNASMIQNGVLKFLCETFDVQDQVICGMTPIISQSYSRSNSKDYDLDESKIDETLSYAFQFFDNVADFCLDPKPFPHKISLLEHEVLLVPETYNHGNIITPFTGERKDKGRYWDLKRGVLRSKNEVMVIIENEEQYKSYKYLSLKRNMLQWGLESLEKKQTVLDESNKNPNCPYRLELGLRAIKAYFLVLLDITGMNDSTLATIKWDDDSFKEEKADSVILRNIKRRAGNKEVIFTIQSIFMGSFRKFIKLRRFVLNGQDCNTLFFITLGGEARLEGTRKSGGYGVHCHRALVSLYPDLLFTGSQMLREHTKRWAMRKTNGQTYLVAAFMQHKPITGEQYYPHETRAESQDQMGDYLIYQHNVIMEMSDSMLTGAGGCNSSTPTPKADSGEVPIKPDCQNKLTCLFCEHYRIKPVKEEIHKVLSMEYVINRHSILHARSLVHFDVVMKPVLKRIALLLQRIIIRYPQTKIIIEELRHDVYNNQNLHWYWEKRLELLWELGWA